MMLEERPPPPSRDDMSDSDLSDIDSIDSGDDLEQARTRTDSDLKAANRDIFADESLVADAGTCRLWEHDGWNRAFAGAFAAIALAVDEKSRRQTIALYSAVRGAEVLAVSLTRYGYLPTIPKATSILFGIVNMPIMYSFVCEPALMSRSYYKWILSMGNITDERLFWGVRARNYVLDQMKKGRTDLQLIPFQPSQRGIYDDGILPLVIVKDWFTGLLRAFKIYAPVHFLPILIFKLKSLLKSPKSTLRRMCMSLGLSCLFLTSYQATIKVTITSGRTMYGEDLWVFPTLAGLLTGLSTLFEKSSRVSELMLYCVPRAAEITFEVQCGYF